MEFKSVSKHYKETKALTDISLTINDGDFIFLVGKTGAGKSTLLKLITKQIEPTSGDIIAYKLSLKDMQHNSVPYYRRLFGIIDIQTSLLNDRTVFDNIAIAMIAVGHGSKAINENVPKALGMVGLAKKMQHYPETLSGSEVFKVHLARAIINNPKIIVADEPTANLDYDTAWDVMCLLRDINKLGITVIISTHAHEFVELMKKRVITLKYGKIHSDINFNTPVKLKDLNNFNLRNRGKVRL